jgi:transcriptional regulator with XRE-family HTH domain
MTIRVKVATRIRQLRGKRGWSQEELARRAGLSRTFLARLETARHDPTLGTLQKLATALRVRITKLLE